jgi:hypothetical protein
MKKPQELWQEIDTFLREIAKDHQKAESLEMLVQYVGGGIQYEHYSLLEALEKLSTTSLAEAKREKLRELEEALLARGDLTPAEKAASPVWTGTYFEGLCDSILFGATNEPEDPEVRKLWRLVSLHRTQRKGMPSKGRRNDGFVYITERLRDLGVPEE